jgi:energy-coupling factor transport system ATP-binding protein
MLDYKGAVHLYKLLKTLNEDYGKTIIVIEHDTDFLQAFAKQVIILDQGEIVLEGDIASVFFQEKKIKQLGIKIPQPIL